MSGEQTPDKQAPAIPEGELIEGLKEDPNYFAVKYNEMRKEELGAAQAAKDASNQADSRRMEPDGQAKSNLPFLGSMATSRAGGVYVPPHKLRRMQEELMKSAQNNEEQKQRIKWEMLRKSINEIINKVNVANIQNVIIELLNENISRGIGLVARAIIKAQMASPNFTHVYAAVVSVLNTKLPDIAHLIIRRVILQFRRAYQRNNKIVCQATTKFLAHLINQKVLSDLFGLELLIFLLDEPTEDSVDIACDFMKECGQVLTELTPAGVNAIFERFKGILHEGETDRKVQYSIENLFAIRKNKFKDYPGVIPELDLVDDEDQITHNIELDAEITGEEHLNIFREDPFFDKTEEEWRQIRLSILGEDNILRLKASAMQLEQEEEDAEPEPQIVDFTEEDLLKLRENIYLVIMNSIDFEECAHKLMKLNIGRGHEEVLSKMIVDCCVQERSYNKFFGLLAQRFCSIDDIYKKFFFRLFVDNYTIIHRFTTNKIRNLAKFFAHLLLTDALDWHVLRCVTLTEEATTSSSRIFLKILFQDLAENMGLKTLCQRMHDPDMREFFVGIFPTDHPQNARFAANFFGLIGLDAVAQPLKESLATGLAHDETEKLLMELAAGTSSSSSSDDSDSSSESSDESEVKKEVKKVEKKDEKRGEDHKGRNGKDEKAREEGKMKEDVKRVETRPREVVKRKMRLSDSKSRSRSEELKKKKESPKQDGATKKKVIEEKHKHEKKQRADRSSSATKAKKTPEKTKEKPRAFKRKRSSSTQKRSSISAEKKVTKKPDIPQVKKPVPENKQTKREPKRSREKEKLRYKIRRDRSEESPVEKKVKEKVSKPAKPSPKKEKKIASPSRSSSSSSISSNSSKSSTPVKQKTTKLEKLEVKKPLKVEKKEKLKLKRRRSKDSYDSSKSSSNSSRSSSSSSPSIKKRKRSRSKEKKEKSIKTKKPEVTKDKIPKEATENKPKEKLKLKRKRFSSSASSQKPEVKPKKAILQKSPPGKAVETKKKPVVTEREVKKPHKKERSSSSHSSSSSSLSSSSNSSSSPSSN